MKCPHCNIMLVCADRDGVEVDYCPKCWGVWLDRGELNQLVAKALSEIPGPPGREEVEAREA